MYLKSIIFIVLSVLVKRLKAYHEKIAESFVFLQNGIVDLK